MTQNLLHCIAHCKPTGYLIKVYRNATTALSMFITIYRELYTVYTHFETLFDVHVPTLKLDNILNILNRLVTGLH